MKYGNFLTKERADEVIELEISKKFETCLEHAGVFKQSESGLRAFDSFITTALSDY